MRSQKTGIADKDYRRGRRALATHDSVAAVKLLRSAVAACPASRPFQLADRLYWLSIALRRLGKDGLAIKALSNAQSMAPRSRARAMYKRLVNGYGMPKTSCSEHDDFRAFCSIQLRRYLEGTPNGRFADHNEADTVLALLADAWIRMNPSTSLAEASCGEKLRIFRDVRVQFPRLRSIPGLSVGRTIAVDFFRGNIIDFDDRCTCGSGLPYRMCCGRTRPPYEPERG